MVWFTLTFIRIPVSFLSVIEIFLNNWRDSKKLLYVFINPNPEIEITIIQTRYYNEKNSYSHDIELVHALKPWR